jgi:membrane protease YdiL (CAAX protease family)
MEFQPIIKKEKHPFLQLILLGVFVLIGAFVGVILGFLVCLPIYGFDLLSNTNWITGQDPTKANALKIILTGQQIGMFLLPAITLALIEKAKPGKFYDFKRPKIPFLLVVFLLMVFVTPFIGYTNELNEHMHLPGFLKGLERWMIEKENEAKLTTEAILNVSNIGGFLINILVIALVPAICEEFIFRGALQRTLHRMLKNHHLMIWVTAIAFSAIHLQFFGFFPRMFLGAAFGYIYFYTKNLWYTIFAHFLNNGYAVVVSYYYKKQNLPVKDLDEMQVPIYVALISLILTLALLKFLKEKQDQEKITSHNYEDANG